MSLVDLQLWIFRLFRLHPETQDLDVKGFLKQRKTDFFGEESSEPDCCLEDYPWGMNEFLTDKCWSSFANKLKRKKHVTQKFMLYVQSSEVRHYGILLKAVHDDYSQLATVVLPGTKCLASSRFAFRDLVDDLTMTAKELAFRTCRPVLCIKGTPLYGKYKGMLLTAVALDANDLSIPVACAVVEGETKESWLWFLRNLERAVVHQSDVCLIHDCKRELIDAVEDLLKSRDRQWRKAESRWCMEDLAENFFAYFGDKKLLLLFKKLCQQKRRHKFGKI
ncbi:hypothetical protein D1007_04893 [Hordeum vulgare]|nr:hypothetical protein D1007_04893 [Hordeum vulgare]